MIEKVKLGDICDLSIGFVGTVSTQYQEGGIPFLRTLNIKPYEIIADDLKRITPEFHASQRKSQLFTDDIIMVHTGVPGICCVIPEEYNNSNCIDAIVIKCHKDRVDPRYLEAYMNTIGYRHIANQQVGCVQKHFNLSEAVDLDVFIPDMDTQKKIAEMVAVINGLIRNNSLISAEINAVIEKIYQYWFVQYEFPNEDGLSYKDNGGSMQYNPVLKRDIPNGWQVENLIQNSLCSVIKTGVDYFTDKIYLPTSNIIGEDIVNGESITFQGRESRANMQPISNSVWFAKMKNSIKHITIPSNAEWFTDHYILSTGFEGLRCSKESLPFIHSIINSSYFEYHKDILSHGATQESVNDDDLKSIKFAVPDARVLELYSNIITPLIETKFETLKKSMELISLREYLLPLLINGQVKQML